MRHWRVERHVCRACEVLEAQASNDHESGRPNFGVKYAVRHVTT